MSGEFLFELIDKAQWSFERKVRSVENEKSWSLNTGKDSIDIIDFYFESFLAFKKWFSSSITISPNAQRFVQQTGDKSSQISLHIP